MIDSLNIYDEIASLMASMDPKKILQFKASEKSQNRLDLLLDQQRESHLSESEKKELEHYLIVNRIVGLAKARALKLLGICLEKN